MLVDRLSVRVRHRSFEDADDGRFARSVCDTALVPKDAGDIPGGYRAPEYWSERLTGIFNLRGTGHIEYSEAYNRWLYRAKARALRAGLSGTTSGMAALDVGSGTGWVVAQLRQRGLRVDGCDITDVAVDRLREAYPDLRFFRLRLGTDRVPVDDATYDVVTAMDVMYHITDDMEWSAGLADLTRVLRPGGRLVVSDRFGADDVVPAEHVRFRSLERWREAAGACGLTLDHVRPMFRWLSLDRAATPLARLPDGLHGASAYVLDYVSRREPHLCCAVWQRT